MGEGGEYFPILKLISMGLLKNMVLEPLWSGNGYGFSLLMVLHRVWLSRQTKNHVFVFSTSNGLTETWKYQSKYKQFELNYQIDIADFRPQHLHNWQKSYLHHKTQHFRSLLIKKEKSFTVCDRMRKTARFSQEPDKKRSCHLENSVHHKLAKQPSHNTRSDIILTTSEKLTTSILLMRLLLVKQDFNTQGSVHLNCSSNAIVFICPCGNIWYWCWRLLKNCKPIEAQLFAIRFERR